MIPFVITFLPLYMQFSNLGLLNTYYALIFPYTANAFGVFLLYQFFKGFPKELEEAARLDGANKWDIFIPNRYSVRTTCFMDIGYIFFHANLQ